MRHLTHEERELIAYITGDAQLSELLDSAACIDAGWLSPEEADDLRKKVEEVDAEACEAEGEADTLRSDLEDAQDRIRELSVLLHEAIALMPLGTKKRADWIVEASTVAIAKVATA